MAKQTKADRIQQIEKELAELKEVYQSKKADWEAQKAQGEQIKQLKEQIKSLEHQAEIAEKQTDYNTVAQIRYGDLPKAQKELSELEAQAASSTVHKDTVDAEDIAAIISKWTGIPLEKLVASEMEKSGLNSCCKCDSPCKSRIKRSEKTDWFLSFPGTDRGRKDRTHQGSGFFSF